MKETIICENIFVSSSETERTKAFNDIWQEIVNLIENSK